LLFGRDGKIAYCSQRLRIVTPQVSASYRDYLLVEVASTREIPHRTENYRQLTHCAQGVGGIRAGDDSQLIDSFLIETERFTRPSALFESPGKATCFLKHDERVTGRLKLAGAQNPLLELARLLVSALFADSER
jgi:hypothetical protein